MSEIVKQEKVKRAKWNTEVIDGLSVEYGFKVVKHTEHHFSLFHPQRGRMDYWPSTGKHGWFNKNKIYGTTTVIQDIEAYLMKHFNPNPPQKLAAFNPNQRIEQLENALRRIIRNPSNDGYVLKKIANEALTTKTSTDERPK